MKICADCGNWKRRGDELFDELTRAYKDIDRLQDLLDLKCDEYRELIEKTSAMRKLLWNNGVDHDH